MEVAGMANIYYRQAILSRGNLWMDCGIVLLRSRHNCPVQIIGQLPSKLDYKLSAVLNLTPTVVIFLFIIHGLKSILKTKITFITIFQIH